MAVLNLTTKKDFEEKAKNSDKLVLVDFWAEWCPPCRMMAPILDDMSKKFDGKLDIVKVNVEESDENKELAAEHGVQGIPNMQIYKDGKVVDQIVGMVPAAGLEDELKKHLDE